MVTMRQVRQRVFGTSGTLLIRSNSDHPHHKEFSRVHDALAEQIRHDYGKVASMVPGDYELTEVAEELYFEAEAIIDRGIEQP